MISHKSGIQYSTFVLFVLLVGILAAPTIAASELPKVGPSVKPLDLSMPPATEEIMAAGQLGGPLHPTHELADKHDIMCRSG